MIRIEGAFCIICGLVPYTFILVFEIDFGRRKILCQERNARIFVNYKSFHFYVV